MAAEAPRGEPVAANDFSKSSSFFDKPKANSNNSPELSQPASKLSQAASKLRQPTSKLRQPASTSTRNTPAVTPPSTCIAEQATHGESDPQAELSVRNPPVQPESGSKRSPSPVPKLDLGLLRKVPVAVSSIEHQSGSAAAASEHEIEPVRLPLCHTPSGHTVVQIDLSSLYPDKVFRQVALTAVFEHLDTTNTGNLNLFGVKQWGLARVGKPYNDDEAKGYMAVYTHQAGQPSNTNEEAMITYESWMQYHKKSEFG